MKSCAEIYKTSRKAVGFTQDVQAEALNVPLRTYQDYESGATPMPEDVAKRMSIVNRDTFLLYQHARTHESASDCLPEVVGGVNPAVAALQLMIAFDNFREHLSNMQMCASDGKIDPSEREKWAKVKEALKPIIKGAFTVEFAKEE
jgi:hypothetical protein